MSKAVTSCIALLLCGAAYSLSENGLVTPVAMRIDDVLPTGLNDHYKAWHVIATQLDANGGKNGISMYFHSTIQQFGLSAEELKGRVFNITILRTKGRDVVEFSVGSERNQ